MLRPSSRFVSLALSLAAVGVGAGFALAQTPPEKLTWDQSRSVYNRRIHPPLPAEKVDWEGRVTALLKEEPGDIIVTAVGDMIFNEQISNLRDGEHQQLFRLMQEADIAYGNLEFSLNDHPEAQRPFYGVPRLARSERAREIIETLQRLSAPYGTTIVDKGWYAEVKLPDPSAPARPASF